MDEIKINPKYKEQANIKVCAKFAKIYFNGLKMIHFSPRAWTLTTRRGVYGYDLERKKNCLRYGKPSVTKTEESEAGQKSNEERASRFFDIHDTSRISVHIQYFDSHREFITQVQTDNIAFYV